MFALERTAEGGGLRSYGDALWWTAMLLTTLGAGYEPITPEGRLLAWLLALFAFSVFGYVTASFASLFVQQDQQATAPPAQSAPGAAASDGAAAAPAAAVLPADEIGALRRELGEVRALLAAMAGTEQPNATKKVSPHGS
jgi:voltage-gated potassium channel Kch